MKLLAFIFEQPSYNFGKSVLSIVACWDSAFKSVVHPTSRPGDVIVTYYVLYINDILLYWSNFKLRYQFSTTILCASILNCSFKQLRSLLTSGTSSNSQ